VTVTLQDETHERDIQKWVLINAFPMKYTGPTLAAKGGTDVAMEELVVAYEAMRFEQIET
jgi:phage tail-like protein